MNITLLTFPVNLCSSIAVFFADFRFYWMLIYDPCHIVGRYKYNQFVQFWQYCHLPKNLKSAQQMMTSTASQTQLLQLKLFSLMSIKLIQPWTSLAAYCTSSCMHGICFVCTLYWTLVMFTLSLCRFYLVCITCILVANWVFGRVVTGYKTKRASVTK